MAEENQENFPNTKIKISKIVNENSLKSASSLFNLSITQQIMASSSVSDTNIQKKEKPKSEKLECTSLAIAKQQNLSLVECRYVRFLQDIKIVDVTYNEQIMPTTMTILPRVASNSNHNYVQLPGTHTTSTATEDLVTITTQMDDSAQTIGNISDSKLTFDLCSTNESITLKEVVDPKIDGSREIAESVQINVEQNAEILLDRNSSDFIPNVPEIIDDSIEVEYSKPSIWNRIKVGCITFCNMIGDFLCHNKEIFICLAFFGGFIVCTSFLTAFFYEILTIDPEHIMYPAINDKVYFSDRQSKY